MKIKKGFFLMRHGETDWNKSRILMGSTDIPLNKTGKYQAQKVAKLLKGKSIDSIVASTLSRAAETGKLINKVLRVEAYTHGGLKECNWGVLEKTYYVTFPTEEYLDRGQMPEGAESAEEFTERVLAAVTSTLESYNTPLIITHGGGMYAIMKALGHKDYGVKNCVPYFIQPDSKTGEWIIREITE